MSIHEVYTAECDTCEKHVPGGPFDLSSRAENAATKAGWVFEHEDTRWTRRLLCPNCQAPTAADSGAL